MATTRDNDTLGDRTQPTGVGRFGRRRALATVMAAALTVVGIASSGWLWDTPAEAAPVGLRVEAEHARTGYDRALFEHWTDADGDGCDTRDEVLIVESVTVVQVTQPGCVLTGGRWSSVYDSVETTDPSTFDVDHLVPLAEAWDSGAWAWDAARREAFANDLELADALVAVTASSNRAKGDQDPAEWQPPNAAVDCWYATAWVQVKIRWDLSADPTEAATLDEMLAGCGTQLPPGGTFGDDNGSPHEPMIEAIAAADITGGCAAGLYCPTTPISRAQMATFLTRALGLPAATADHFGDDNGNPHEDAINRVAEAGIAGGTRPGVYDPAGLVSRAQMGTFLGRALDLAEVPTGPFADIAGSPHAGYINAIAAAGITSGCNPQGTLYCPTTPVSRGQMATFLGRALNLAPITPPPPTTTTTTAPPTTTTTTPSVPANPGDTRNCSDFATWSEAQAWFDTYYPHYGDVASLDGDGDRIACESLPGAP